MSVSDANNSLLARLDRYLAKIEDGLAFVAALFILGLMILGAINVLGRKLGMPVWGYNDIVVLSMVSFAFLSISAMQRVGGHIRMELLIRRLKGRVLWVSEFLGTIIAVLIIAVLLWYSGKAFYEAYSLGDSTMDREIPTWPSKLWVPVSFAVLVARLLLQAWGYMRLIINPNAEQIAVPKLAEAHEMADKEIADTFGDTTTNTKSGTV